jgi:peroxiredoxin
MIELGELEKNHQEFEKRNARIIAVSVEEPKDASQTQDQFKHLTVLDDKDEGLAAKAEMLDDHASPYGEDMNAPTTILIDRNGIVRWLFRPTRYLTRLTPQEVLEAMDKYLSPDKSPGGS